MPPRPPCIGGDGSLPRQASTPPARSRSRIGSPDGARSSTKAKFSRCLSDQWKPIYDDFAQQCKTEHDEVVAIGGLHILGTERHEARRIDNQLRGRAGRQGDPGSSRFFLSLEDDLHAHLRRRAHQGSDVSPRHDRRRAYRIENDFAAVSKRRSKSVEAQNFDARKHLLEYDDVMNKQRETIYAIRRSALEGQDQSEFVLEKAENVALDLVDTYCPQTQHPGQWNTTQFLAEMNAQFGIDAKAAGADPGELSHEQLADAAKEAVVKRYEEKENQFGNELMRWLERRIVLDVVDTQWKDHLLSLDHLKEGIGLRGYAQKDPIVEFKKEAFILFEDMMARIDNETIRYLFHIVIQQAQQHPDDMQTSPDAQVGPSGPGSAGPGGAPGAGGPGAGGPRQIPPSAAPRSGGASAAMASAAARAQEPPAQRLPDVARQLDRKQQRQQQDLQYQTGAAQAEPPNPSAQPPKLAATTPVPAAPAKNTRNATAKANSARTSARWFW